MDDFRLHWPTADDGIRVDCVRKGSVGRGNVRNGSARWRRLTEIRAGGAKSVFHFDVPGSVAKSTHSGLPWLGIIRQELQSAVHVWPFDGWTIPPGRSVIAEVYPSLWSHLCPHPSLTPDQRDAYAITAWLAQADRSGELKRHLTPVLDAQERAVAEIEGWILGVA